MTLEAQDNKGLSVYWDYETTRLPNFKAVSGYEVVKKIRSALHTFGPIQSFKTYHDSSNQPSSNLHAELGSSGLTLIDCPSNGRKETTTKTMIVDIIAHAWDHPAPRTIAIITGDRDLAYLIATLRMRKFQVVLVSPTGTHASLTIQASVNIDWTTGMANVDSRGTDEFRGGPPPSHRLPPSPQPLPSPHLPPSPSFPPPPLPTTSGFFSHFPKTDFLSKAQEEIDPPMVELRGMPTIRGRQNSIFGHSYERDRYNVFDDLGGSFPSPRISNGMFGLGDGPLFARSQPRVPARQIRSDSAPPGMVYPIHSPSGPSSPPERISFEGIAPSTKGKQREFPITEPEDIALQSPMPKEVESTSGRTGMKEIFTNTHSKSNAPLPSRTSTSSSGTAQDSVFSVPQFPLSSATTTADTVYIDNDKAERGKNPATIVDTVPEEPTAPLKSPTVRDKENVSAAPSPRKGETSNAISNRSSPPQADLSVQLQTHNPFQSFSTPPSSSNKAPPKEAIVKAQAGPSGSTSSSMSVPPKFRVLAETLRGHNGSCLRSSLPGLLLVRDPEVYKKAKVSKYSKYIAAAMEAGLVEESSTTKGPSIFLTAPYTT